MKKLYRSRDEKKIAGICGGLGEMFSFDPTLIRLLFVFLGFITGVVPIIIVYVIGWIIIPESPQRKK